MCEYYHVIWLGWIGCTFEVKLGGDGFKPWFEQSIFFLLKFTLACTWKGT